MASQDGDDPLGILTFYLHQLEAGLLKAQPYRGKDGRMEARIALEAVLDFLYAFQNITSKNLHRPLFELHAALNDLDHNLVHPILKPAKRTGRPLRGTVQSEVRGHTLRAVELLVECGNSPPEACRKVAHVWNKLVRRRGGHSPQWSTILDWYNDSELLPKDDPEKEVIAALSLARSGQKHTEPEILDDLERTFKQLGPP